MPDQDTLYARWLNGDISPEEEKALRSSGEWAELDAIINAANSFTLPRYDQDDAYKALKSKKKDTRVLPLNAKWIMGIAASVSVLVAAYFVLTPTHTQISAAYAENQIHHTSDESIIVLNDGSSISYDESDWKNERIVNLIGEASFDVIEGSPFIVQTAYGQVEVLGTTFNVRSWDNAISVECYTGRVKVTYGGKEAVLTKGKGVKIAGNNSTSFNIDHNSAKWQSGLSIFRSERIENVFFELGRQYNVVVEYEGDRMRFSGGFVHDDINNALYQITGPLGMSYEIKPDNIVRVFK